jgi:hypothetical protein
MGCGVPSLAAGSGAPRAGGGARGGGGTYLVSAGGKIGNDSGGARAADGGY